MNFTPLSYTLCALIAILGISHQWSSPESFPWWRLATALFVLGLLYEWLRVRAIASVLISVDESVIKLILGKQNKIQLIFKNSLPRDLAIQFVTALPEEFETTRLTSYAKLGGFETRHVDISVRAGYLGQYHWPPIPMRIKGALGLCWWPRRQDMDCRFDIVPDLLSSGASVSSSASLGSQHQGLGAGLELHHLRNYVAGDPRHAIDWKATARTNNLVTRVYSEDQHLEIILVVDVGRTSRTEVDGLSQLGHYVNLSARFSEHAIACEDRIGLIAVADKTVAVVPPDRGVRAVLSIRKTLFSLKSQAVETDFLAAALEVQNLVKHRSLVILLTDLYGQSVDGSLEKSIRLWSPKHLPLIVGLMGEELSSFSGQNANDVSQVYQSMAATNYILELERVATSVKRLGAHMVLSRPADLERLVFQRYQLLKAQHRI